MSPKAFNTEELIFFFGGKYATAGRKFRDKNQFPKIFCDSDCVQLAGLHWVKFLKMPCQ